MGNGGFNGSLQPMGVSVHGSMGEPGGGWATIQRVRGAHIFVQLGEEGRARGCLGGVVCG